MSCLSPATSTPSGAQCRVSFGTGSPKTGATKASSPSRRPRSYCSLLPGALASRGTATPQPPPPPFISGLRSPRSSVGSHRRAKTQASTSTADPFKLRTQPETAIPDLAARARAALAAPDPEHCNTSRTVQHCDQASAAKKHQVTVPLAAAKVDQQSEEPNMVSKDSLENADHTPGRSPGIACLLPLKSLASCPEEVSGSRLSLATTTLTPHALTDTALRKSEVLLAQLSALGLNTDKNGFYLEEVEHEEAADEGIYQMPKSDCSSPKSWAALTPKATDTVEVPVVLLDMFVETWSKYRKLHLSSGSQAKEADGAESCETHLSEPEPEVSSAKASDDASSTRTSQASDAAEDLASLPSPQMSASSCPSGALSPLSGLGSPSPPRILCASSPIHSKQMRDGNAMQFRRSCPLVQANLQGGRSHVACRPVSCTVQQTVTITNTVHFHH